MLNLSADAFRFTFNAADPDFLGIEFKAEEKISQLYQIDLILASEEAYAQPDSLLIEADQRRASLVWRASILSKPPIRALESRLLKAGRHG